MIKLADKFIKQGCFYEMIRRWGDLAIYAVSYDGKRAIGYDTVIVITVPAGNLFGKYYPEHERYPSSEEFGFRGWSFSTFKMAENQLNNILIMRAKPNCPFRCSKMVDLRKIDQWKG